MLEFTTDQYNGVRCVDETKIPKNPKEFEKKLVYSLNVWKKTGKRGAWIKIPIYLIHYLPFCIKQGYNVHHGNENYIMVQQWLPTNEKSMIPSYAYAYVGSHCVIVNKKKEIVLIKEHYGEDSWKIPGGAVDPGEYLSDAGIREAKEETGLDCEFVGILAIRHLLNFRFGNTCDISSISIVRLKNDKQKLNPLHKNEIKHIKWIKLEEFIKSGNHIFLGSDEENLNALKHSVDWLMENWGKDLHSNEIFSKSGLIRPFKQTHPFRKDAKTLLYHQ